MGLCHTHGWWWRHVLVDHIDICMAAYMAGFHVLAPLTLAGEELVPECLQLCLILCSNLVHLLEAFISNSLNFLAEDLAKLLWLDVCTSTCKSLLG